MTLTQDGTTLRERLNDGTGVTAEKLSITRHGNVLSALPTSLFGKKPATSPYQLATLAALILPDFAKAAVIHRATARAADTGTPGPLVIKGYGVTPGAGEIAVAPNGDIVFLASEAWTKVDLLYVPWKHDTAEVELPVASDGSLVLPTTINSLPVAPIDLLEAEVTVGSGAGKKIILVPADTIAATKAGLNLAKTKVIFGDAGASVASKARVKFSIAPAVDLQSTLMASSTI